MNFLLRRFGTEKFLELYTRCRQATFEADCRRILGLDLDGLDAAYRAEIDRLVSDAGPIERVRLERLRRWYWLPLPIGALGLVAGAAIGMRRGRDEHAPTT